jgi:alpha-tubulin suppressor-like RCC1 family protein
LPNNDWVAIAAGGGHSLALKSNKTLWSWGFNGSGQLGNGINIDASVPLALTLPAPFVNNNWTNLTAGRMQSLALKTDGTLWLWGENSASQLGNGSDVNSDVPVQESNPTNTWVSADFGDSHVLGRKSDGTLWSWGSNAAGQLGSGNTADSKVPAKIGADSDWLDVAAGIAHSIALKTNGTIWTWGENGSGQLGDGTSTARNSPVPVSQARFLPKGDLTQNGAVDIGDALRALRIIVGFVPQTADDLILGDVTPLINGDIVPDGRIDLTDALQILRKIVGLINF